MSILLLIMSTLLYEHISFVSTLPLLAPHSYKLPTVINSLLLLWAPYLATIMSTLML